MKTIVDTGNIRVRQIRSDGYGKFEYNVCSEKYVVIYIMDGTGRYNIEGAPLDFSNSTALILRPSVYCLLESENKEMNIFVIEFGEDDLIGDAPGKLKPLFDEVLLNDAKYKRTDKGFRMLVDQLDLVAVMPEEQKRSYLELLVSQMIVLLSASGDGREVGFSSELGARVIEYLNDNVTGGSISLDELSHRFFVSKYYLCRAFKKYNGISVHGYINRKRITYAKQLIDRGETASGAAYKVGYGDYSAFYRAYIKIIGKSPTE